VIFREIKNPTFAIQTVGRILRMPFGEPFAVPELNIGYLYTNYKRNEVISQYDKNKTFNRPEINGSYRKSDVVPIEIKSTFMSRTDYNDLGDSFQKIFTKVANKNLKANLDKLDLNAHITNEIVTGVEIDDYDNFKSELLSEGGNFGLEMSQNDIEKLYNLICFKTISEQTYENKK